MASEEARRQLFEAVTAHKVHLEITRGFAGLELEVLNRRIEAAGLLLKWISQALEPRPAAFPAAQTQPLSRVRARQDQTPQSASDPLCETSPTD
jgi:hypothetical protein